MVEQVSTTNIWIGAFRKVEFGNGWIIQRGDLRTGCMDHPIAGCGSLDSYAK